MGPSDFGFWSIDTGLVIPGVHVDIKPGSCPNPVNLNSRGLIPVAILGTDNFDVQYVDPASIRLNRSEYPGVSPLRWNYEDVAAPFSGPICQCHDLNCDGYLDLTLKFDARELTQTLGLDDEAGNMITLWLTGNLIPELGGTPIRGRDCILIR